MTNFYQFANVSYSYISIYSLPIEKHKIMDGVSLIYINKWQFSLCSWRNPLNIYRKLVYGMIFSQINPSNRNEKLFFFKTKSKKPRTCWSKTKMDLCYWNARDNWLCTIERLNGWKFPIRTWYCQASSFLSSSESMLNLKKPKIWMKFYMFSWALTNFF